MRILLYAGKGGVGKTCVAGATGIISARMGLKTLVMSLDPAHSLSDAFDLDLSRFAPELEGRLRHPEKTGGRQGIGRKRSPGRINRHLSPDLRLPILDQFCPLTRGRQSQSLVSHDLVIGTLLGYFK